MELSKQLREILSWRLVTETVRRAPDRLRIYELHPGGGQYDCLSLYTVDGKAVADLNRLGRLQISGQLRERRNSDSPVMRGEEAAWDVWPEALVAVDPTELVDGICRRIGLDVPEKLPPSNPIVLVYRFITEFLSRTAFARDHWECRSGFYDSSGGDSGICDKLFAAFPSAHERLQVCPDETGTVHPACNFWFILRDSEPVLCLETSGLVTNLAGRTVELPTAYQVPRRIWPMITEIAEDLLP